MNRLLISIGLFISLIAFSCKSNTSDSKNSNQNEWISIFNGQDLDGWTPKITGYTSGEDPYNTFRVENGAITVSYENYDTFANHFGHLFYKEELSHYKLRLKYRFFGDQVNGGPSWAYKNSGIMYHGEHPDSMEIDQFFPVSLEGQFLGGNGTDPRPTANLCTPGMNVVIGDSVVTNHCISSNSETIHDDQWVSYEMVVNGGDNIHHLVNGDTVFTFSNPTYGGNGLAEEMRSLEGEIVQSGTISLQSESHPVQFKDIEIQKLK